MLDQFRNKFPLNDSKWIEYTNHFNRLEVAAKTILLEEGEISKKLFIIEEGCIRVWFNNNGKDLTTQFFFENQSVASIESFMKKIPSPVVMETIEPSVIWWISKNDLDKILEEIKEIPELRDRFINMLFERTFDYMKHFVSFIKDSPTQRYLNLIEERPQVLQRVPQHYIASYLGVSTVHLSRIKSQLLHAK
ncbi:cAMP-binding domain of CRP or a regulatory subunit of cAMP-dependent protein kinases [Flavobacterium aquidurense]|uniref:Cyclic nucleotide-binding protein n=1 Tax=Flavobacterium frigidimaris TaxID=262320 RepID=A0ABX4BW11_FLAFR|nr:Crp/Fnr family transcriptional regulator [Flavobacterium frigidimaris]OXA81613.1 cyclic nucleotide-binding protein [Flavobacterium frigidimaris]SDZ53083.1 cAMP-binding domain of CRP or a regulatory subunit of cAMP-dependent protein kinases [Flavobacterium aquidurense]